AIDEWQLLALPRRHAGFLEQILQRAARPARIRLQALAPRAQPDHESFHEALIDALPVRAAEAQLPAERGQREPPLAAPGDGAEFARRLPLKANFAPIQPQPRAVVLDERARPARAELAQHLDQLRLARRLQAFGREELAQQVLVAQFLGGKMPCGARQRFAPARIALAQQRRDAQPDEIAREGVRGVALVFDPLQAVLARISEDRFARQVKQGPQEDPF